MKQRASARPGQQRRTGGRAFGHLSPCSPVSLPTGAVAVPSPARKLQSMWHMIRGLGKLRHRGRGPAEIRLQRVSQRQVVRKSGVIQSERETGLRSFIQFPMLAVSRMKSNHERFVSHRVRVVRRAAQGLDPIRGESSRMIRVKTMRKRVADNGIGQASLVPSMSQFKERPASPGGFVNRGSHRTSIEGIARPVSMLQKRRMEKSRGVRGPRSICARSHKRGYGEGWPAIADDA